MLQSVSSVFVVYRRKTLTGSPDPTHANGTDKPCNLCKQKIDHELSNIFHLVIVVENYSTMATRDFFEKNNTIKTGIQGLKRRLRIYPLRNTKILSNFFPKRHHYQFWIQDFSDWGGAKLVFWQNPII